MWMQMIIRKINPADAASIAALSRQLGYHATEIETAERIIRIENNSEHFIRLVEISNQVVGWIHAFVSLHLESAPFVEIGGLVVDENFRNRGIGQKLIAEVEKWAIEKKLNNLRVRSNSIRKETHQFYINRGFQLTKEQKIFDKRIS
jgi:predicted N-acetyltransferase YhbS